MRLIINPKRETWPEYMNRDLSNSEKIREQARDISNSVRKNGDEALLQFTRTFDRIALRDLRVPKEEISASEELLDSPLKDAIEKAWTNIWKFHASQKIDSNKIETSPGVYCWRESRAIENVGLYIPAGTAPLFSTLLMLGIPAKIAGCKKIIVCSAPQPDGKVHPNILYCANLLGLDKVYAVGGAQAIAAMAYGTESIPACDKIFGPGNQYVTAAKEIVQSEKCSIDMPAGPSEVLVIADKNANPGFVASDLLSQAEHGVDSQVILLSNSKRLCDQVLEQIEIQIENLDRKVIAKKALENSAAIVLKSIEECFDFSNRYAPEHLILSKDDETWIDLVESAGSVFIGPYSCESAGDYASGTNHTLPTNAWARSLSGLSLSSFQKSISFQRLSAQGLEDLGPSIEILAEAENLMAHKNAVSIRLQTLAKTEKNISPIMNSIKTSEAMSGGIDDMPDNNVITKKLRDLIRPDLQDWSAYSSARSENASQTENPVLLDANENPFGKWNRYPDPIQKELREELAAMLETNPENLFLGNGSDEIIDLLIRCFCLPQQDEIVSFSPGFSMYGYAARLSNVKCTLLPLDEQWQIPASAISQIKEIKPKITFLCSPNNPTGNSLRSENIELIVQESPGLVVVDEAYIEFSQQESFKEKLDSYPNLLILRTMSKAWALAGIRLGILIANPLISNLLQSFKMPYNISSPNQQEALAQLRNKEVVNRQIETILEERNRLEKILPEYDLVERCFPSDSNFLLVQFKSSQKVYEELKAQNCLVRDRSKQVPGALRISIGSPEENQFLLQALENIQL